MLIMDENLRLKVEDVVKSLKSKGLLDTSDEDVIKVAVKLGIDMVKDLTPSQFIKYSK